MTTWWLVYSKAPRVSNGRLKFCNASSMHFILYLFSNLWLAMQDYICYYIQGLIRDKMYLMCAVNLYLLSFLVDNNTRHVDKPFRLISKSFFNKCSKAAYLQPFNINYSVIRQMYTLQTWRKPISLQNIPSTMFRCLFVKCNM